MTHAEKNAVILDALADAIAERDKEIKELYDETDGWIMKVNDLSQELAVTQSQLEEARERLKRYEGGGK